MKDWICKNLDTVFNRLLTIILGILTIIVGINANIISNNSNLIASNANKIMESSNINYEVSFDGQKNYLLNKLSELGELLLDASSIDDLDVQTEYVQKYVNGVMDEDFRKRIIAVGNNETIVAHNKIKYYTEDRSYKVDPDFILRKKENGVLNFLVLHFNLVNSVKNSYQGVDVVNTNSRDEVREIFNFYLSEKVRNDEDNMDTLEYSLKRFEI